MNIKPIVHLTHEDIAKYISEKFKDRQPTSHHEVMLAIDELFNRFFIVDRSINTSVIEFTGVESVRIGREAREIFGEYTNDHKEFGNFILKIVFESNQVHFQRLDEKLKDAMALIKTFSDNGYRSAVKFMEKYKE